MVEYIRKPVTVCMCNVQLTNIYIYIHEHNKMAIIYILINFIDHILIVGFFSFPLQGEGSCVVVFYNSI